MIAGHSTGITLEDAFWYELVRIAKDDGKSVNTLITEIDKEKAPEDNLSGAVRVYILTSVKAGR